MAMNSENNDCLETAINMIRDYPLSSDSGNESSVRQWPGRPGFNPRSSHTKDSKNGT